MVKKQEKAPCRIEQRVMGAVLGRTDSGEAAAGRRFTVSFASEEPYRRYCGLEILDHGEGAVDLARLNSVGVMLFNHNRDKVLGKVLRAWIENRRSVAEVEFDDDEFAAMICKKVDGGTLKTTSVAYTVDSWEEVKAGATSADGRFQGPCLIARRWTPLEVSIVSVPADSTVGVGRSEAEAALEEGRLDSAVDCASCLLCERQVQINKNKFMAGGK